MRGTFVVSVDDCHRSAALIMLAFYFAGCLNDVITICFIFHRVFVVPDSAKHSFIDKFSRFIYSLS